MIDFNKLRTTPTDTLVDEWMTTASTINPNVLLAALEQSGGQQQGLSLGGALSPQPAGVGLKPGGGGLGLVPPPGGMPMKDPLATPAPTGQIPPMFGAGIGIMQAARTPAPAARPAGPDVGPAPRPAPIPNYFQASAPSGARRGRSLGDLLGGY